jgi:hypothetical protein
MVSPQVRLELLRHKSFFESMQGERGGTAANDLMSNDTSNGRTVLTQPPLNDTTSPGASGESGVVQSKVVNSIECQFAFSESTD